MSKSDSLSHQKMSSIPPREPYLVVWRLRLTRLRYPHHVHVLLHTLSSLIKGTWLGGQKACSSTTGLGFDSRCAQCESMARLFFSQPSCLA